MKQKLIDAGWLLHDLVAWLVMAWLIVVGLGFSSFLVGMIKAVGDSRGRVFLIQYARNNWLLNRAFFKWLYKQCPDCGQWYTGLVGVNGVWLCQACHHKRTLDGIKEILDRTPPASVLLHREQMKGRMNAAAMWVLVFILFILYLILT